MTRDEAVERLSRALAVYDKAVSNKDTVNAVGGVLAAARAVTRATE